ncbi:protein eva-1 homolog A [Canis aureus]
MRGWMRRELGGLLSNPDSSPARAPGQGGDGWWEPSGALQRAGRPAGDLGSASRLGVEEAEAPQAAALQDPRLSSAHGGSGLGEGGGGEGGQLLRRLRGSERPPASAEASTQHPAPSAPRPAPRARPGGPPPGSPPRRPSRPEPRAPPRRLLAASSPRRSLGSPSSAPRAPSAAPGSARRGPGGPGEEPENPTEANQVSEPLLLGTNITRDELFLPDNPVSLTARLSPENPERAALYFVSGVCIGLVLTLAALVMRLSCRTDCRPRPRKKFLQDRGSSSDSSDSEDGSSDTASDISVRRHRRFERTLNKNVFTSAEELERAQRLEERERIIREIWMNGQPDGPGTRSLNRYY